VDVVPVQNAKDLDRFIGYVYARYRGVPNWVPPLADDEKVRLTPGKNPFFEHGEAACFLAMDSGRIVGRIAASTDKNHDAYHGERQAAFGFFEAESAEAARALLAEAERWARAKGAQVLRGPLSFTTNDECGLLIEGFDVRPMLMMPWNPPEYAGWIESAGLGKAKDLYTWRIAPPEEPPAVYQRIAGIAKKRERVVVRQLDMKRFNEDLGRLKIVYNAGWEKNWGFVPMTDAEIDHMAKQLKPAVVPSLVLFAEIDGAPVGFGFVIPDVNTALAKVGGKLFPFGIVKLLWNLPRIREGRLMALGVLPEYQKRGIGAVLVEGLMRATRDAHYTTCELGWTLEDNDSVHDLILTSGGTRAAAYRIYEKPIAT
jgi:GNAT superfamily N-acetyltransferase